MCAEEKQTVATHIVVNQISNLVKVDSLSSLASTTTHQLLAIYSRRFAAFDLVFLKAPPWPLSHVNKSSRRLRTTNLFSISTRLRGNSFSLFSLTSKHQHCRKESLFVQIHSRWCPSHLKNFYYLSICFECAGTRIPTCLVCFAWKRAKRLCRKTLR